MSTELMDARGVLDDDVRAALASALASPAEGQ
jgi:hypothetical protein